MAQLKDEQWVWAQELAGNAEKIDAATELQARKTTLVTNAWSELEPRIAEIHVGEAFVMEMKSGGLTGFLRRTFKAPKTMEGISSDSDDADDEFDTGHDLKNAKGLTPEQATQLNKAHGYIVVEVGKLRTALDDKRKPIFAETEIAHAIWEPLMRRKIIPENAITDKSSAVSRTFEGASEQYDVRLTAYTDSLGKFDGLAAKLGLSSDVIKGMGNAATGIMGALTAAVPGMKDFPLAKATDICTAITLTLTAGTDISAQLLKDRGLTAKGVEGIAKSVVGAATGWITAAFDIKFSGTTDDDKIGKELGKALVSGVKIGLSGTVFAAKIAQGGDKAKEAFDEVGTMVEQVFVCAGSAKSFDKHELNDNSLALIGRRVKTGIIGAKELAIILTAADADDPAGTVAKAMQNMMKAAIEEGAKTYATERQAARKTHDKDKQTEEDKNDSSTEGKKKHKEEFDNSRTVDSNFTTNTDTANITTGTTALALDVPGLLKLAQTQTKEQLEKLFKDDPQLKANAAAQKMMLAVAEKRDKELEAAGLEMTEEVADDDRAFRALLNASEAMDSDADVESIEILILQIKKDQMIMKLAESLASMPAAAVAAFLPPAAIASDAIQLVIAMRKAAAHLLAWQEWQENVIDARSAMSVQVAAMANRAGISEGQAIRKSIEAAEHAIKLIGDVFGTVGGPFAPIGIGLSKGVSAASSLKDIILKLYDAKKLQTNWKLYLKALANPDDRKAIRAAIRGNPTLAKYVIAFGAVVEGDPVAKNALNKCGLNEKVLSSPKTNQQKVVSFLEALYAEDPVVLHRLKDPPKWHPGPVTLSPTSIAAFSKAGMTKAKPAFDAPIPTNIPKTLMAAEAARNAAAIARQNWEEAARLEPPDPNLEKLQKTLTQAMTGAAAAWNVCLGNIETWQPKDGDKPHKEATAYQSILVRLAQSHLAKAKQDLTTVDAEPF